MTSKESTCDRSANINIRPRARFRVPASTRAAKLKAHMYKTRKTRPPLAAVYYRIRPIQHMARRNDSENVSFDIREAQRKIIETMRLGQTSPFNTIQSVQRLFQRPHPRPHVQVRFTFTSLVVHIGSRNIFLFHISTSRWGSRFQNPRTLYLVLFSSSCCCPSSTWPGISPGCQLVSPDSKVSLRNYRTELRIGVLYYYYYYYYYYCYIIFSDMFLITKCRRIRILQYISHSVRIIARERNTAGQSKCLEFIQRFEARCLYPYSDYAIQTVWERRHSKAVLSHILYINPGQDGGGIGTYYHLQERSQAFVYYD